MLIKTAIKTKIGHPGHECMFNIFTNVEGH